MIPPPLPSDSLYTRCYCEENVYLLCQTFLQDPSVKNLWEIFVVFISNANKTVALWYQKAARFPDSPVIWDYHVILILRPQGKELTINAEQPAIHSWVYDFDTSLDLPCPWEEYLSMAFPEDLLPAYQSRFRVMHGELYLQNFASDRSHMLLKGKNGTIKDGSDAATETEELIYSLPPPAYALICGTSAAERGITNNLMEQYVAMTDDSEADLYGVVLDRPGVNSFFEC